MYIDTTGGRAEDGNTIFAANNSEWYPHEMVHFYTGRVFSHGSWIADEGYATYLGGTGGLPLEHALRTAARYYQRNPGRNILNDVEKEYRIDGRMQVIYPVGGLICKLVDEQSGFDGIRQLFSLEDFSAAVELTLHIKKSDLSGFIMNELAKYR